MAFTVSSYNSRFPVMGVAAATAPVTISAVDPLSAIGVSLFVTGWVLWQSRNLSNSPSGGYCRLDDRKWEEHFRNYGYSLPDVFRYAQFMAEQEAKRTGASSHAGGGAASPIVPGFANDPSAVLDAYHRYPWLDYTSERHIIIDAGETLTPAQLVYQRFTNQVTLVDREIAERLFPVFDTYWPENPFFSQEEMSANLREKYFGERDYNSRARDPNGKSRVQNIADLPDEMIDDAVDALMAEGALKDDGTPVITKPSLYYYLRAVYPMGFGYQLKIK